MTKLIRRNGPWPERVAFWGTTISFPLILLWAYFSRLVIEFGRAFWWAWSDVRCEVEYFRKAWKDGHL